MTPAEPWSPRWLLPTLVGLVAVPLVVAVVAQRNAHWYPVFDLAMTELRVRDVGGSHTPLIGLQGRIGPTGSHPGPISFYLLAPVYRLLGSSSFALQVASAILHLAAAATALVVVRRRRHGWALAAFAIVLLLLLIGYGLGPLTEPWNPHLPVLWFVAFLVSCWAVLDGDLPMLVPAVVAASICAQTHVPYLAVTTAIGVAVFAAAGAREVLRTRRSGSPLALRWFAIAAFVGLVLWAPPLVDEVVHEPGNLSQIVDHLGTPEEAPIGISAARTLVLERLDAWHLVVVQPRHPGTSIRTLSGPGPDAARGAVTAAVWAACVAWALLRRHRRLLAVHAVVGVAAIVALFAVSRINGVPWSYLMFWGFGIGALMLLSIGATVATTVRHLGPRWTGERAVRPVGLVLVAVAAVLSVRLVLLAPDATTETPDETAQLARLVGPTVARLEAGSGAATGREGRYKVVWYDATHGGAVGIGMVNELVRRGFDVGVDDRDRIQIGPHRVRADDDATARVIVASGGWIDEVAGEPGAERVAFDDPRTAAERAEYAETRDRAAALLVATGSAALVEVLDRDVFRIALNERVDPAVSPLVARLLDIGVPTAVFVVPGGGS